MTKVNALLITKGHPFDKGAFFDLFDSLDLNYTHVEQPAAVVFFETEMARDYDVFVLYDMPGIQFGPGGPIFEQPPETYKSNFINLLKSGKGMVFMHHSIAGWPAWEEYAEIIGGRFLYLPTILRGVTCQDSGYRHDIRHLVRPAMEHPITSGLPATFEMTDELYLSEVFTDSVTPLLASDYEFKSDNFYSAARVVQEGKMFDNENWQHRPGSNLVGWTKTYGRSPIVYIQGGDGPAAYGDSNYRKLLNNAIHWAADPINLTGC